jgi:Uri superfamily endonuclease
LLALPMGYYAYVGSALGAGGLAARIGHHLVRKGRPHWHIDALCAHASPVAAWYAIGPERRECAWAKALSALDGASLPAQGFGSSDCRCPTHLIHFSCRPDSPTLVRSCGGRLLYESFE